MTIKKPETINQNVAAPKRPNILPCDVYKTKAKGETFIVAVGLFDGKPYEAFVFRPTDEVKLTESKGEIIKNGKNNYSLKSKDLNISNLLNTNITDEEKSLSLMISMTLRHGLALKYIIKTAKKVNPNIMSFSSALCRILSKYLPKEIAGKCPECGADLIHESGCVHCSICSYSRCD